MSDQLITQLNLKYSEFLDASKNTSLPRVSKGIYEYIDLIQREDIQKIIGQDKVEIESKKVAVNSDKYISEKDKIKSIKRIDKHSFSRSYSFVYDKIYLPIKTYRESPTASSEIVTRGQALSFQTYRDGYQDILKYIDGLLITFTFYCALDDLDIHMDRIHTTLIKKILEISPTTPTESTSNKIQIIIDDRKGIYQSTNPALTYGVKKISKRMKLIKHLASKDNCNISELENLTHQETDVTIRCISEINRLFREKLELTDDLILHLNTGGYSLNKEVFDIRIQS